MRNDHALADESPDDWPERPASAPVPPAEDRTFRTAAQVQRFLYEFANTREDWVAIRRFFDRYGRVLPGPMWGEEKYRDEAGLWHPLMVDQRFPSLQKVVRKAWVEPDGRRRTYILIPILAQFIGQPLQPRNVIDQAFRYLIEHPGLTRFCRKEGCPAPYFFAARRGQRYCSEACAVDAQRAHKRKWWAENGPNWRQERLKKSARKSTRRRR